SQLLTGVAGIQKVRHIGENEVIVWVQKFPAEVLDRFRLYNQLTPAQKQSVAYADALHCCVQNFVREGIVPLNFTGSYLTQSQMSCYEITVLNLILPNVQLDSAPRACASFSRVMRMDPGDGAESTPAMLRKPSRVPHVDTLPLSVRVRKPPFQRTSSLLRTIRWPRSCA
ncbi:MAG: hypothetical protein EBX02_08690, partial [Betaproteobacteria bacterium]|nr:hypothetical protein [Betaproteobacteria bacterium]